MENDNYIAESGLEVRMSIVTPTLRLSNPAILPFVDYSERFTDSILYSIIKFFTCFVVMVVVAFGLALIGSQFDVLREHGASLGLICGAIGCLAFTLTEHLFSYFE